MSLIPYIAPNKKIKKKKKRKKAYRKAVNRATKAVSVANLGGYKKTGGLARWGGHTWTITADHIRTISKAEFEAEWDSDKKKREPAEAVISYPVYKDLQPNVDIASEIRMWRSSIGKTSYLYVGGTQFGSRKKYRLTGVKVKDVEQISGEIVCCSIELTFTEVRGSKTSKIPKRATKKTTKKSTKKKKKAAAAWVKDSNGWRYRRANGSYAPKGWLKVNGKWYLMGSGGYMLTGWQEWNDKWYLLAANGEMLTGWQEWNGTNYYLQPKTDETGDSYGYWVEGA